LERDLGHERARESDAAEGRRLPFAARLGVPLLLGVVVVKDVNDARQHAFNNSVVITDGRGVVRGRYDKQELVPFSEKMPFGEHLPILYEISPNSAKFEARKALGHMPHAGHWIAAMVCNDDVVPSLGNRVVADPASTRW
jgi:apolipoprotein N-acyltransferase